MIKAGVVGVGSMGQNHARIYSELDCELVGIADTNAAQAKEIADKFHTDYFTDYHELISRVDAVSIGVPTTLHHKIAMDFLSQRVHCLVEKPISSDLSRAKEMINAAKANGAVLAVGHIENFNPAVKKLKQIIDEGILGQLVMLSARRVGPYSPRIRDVGIIVDTATHDIGVINYLTGRIPSDIISKVGTFNHRMDDHGIMVLDYQGIYASIEVNWFTPHKVRTLVVTGSEGIAYLDYIDQTISVHNSHDTKKHEIIKEEPLKLEIQDFLDSISENRAPLVNGHQAKDILEIALRVSNGG